MSLQQELEHLKEELRQDELLRLRLEGEVAR